MHGSYRQARRHKVWIAITAAAVVAITVNRAAPATFAEASTVVAPDSALLQRMLQAEDARQPDSASVVPILQGLRSADVETRRIAVRAIGRMESRANLSALEPMLTDPMPSVRAEAVNAIAQIAKADAALPPEADTRLRVWMAMQGLLRGLTATEVDREVRGTLARTIGRLPYPNETVARGATESIAGLMEPLPSAGPLAREPWFGILHGTDALLRRFPALRTAPGVLRVAGIPRVPTIVGTSSSDSSWSREANVILTAIRGRVLSAPTNGDEASVAGIRARFLTDFGDADAQVRRQVASQVATAVALDDAAKSRIITAALADPSASVRIEGVRAYARVRVAKCESLITATRDANALVALTAIDALATPCESPNDAVARLSQLLRELPRGPTKRTGVKGSWHSGAHAAVSLARIAPDSVRRVMSALATHPVWQVRMYAGRAAGVLADTATLAKLAADRTDNVRDAVVNALSDLIRPAAGASAPQITRTARTDSILLAQLARPDYQLILNAAKALDGSSLDARGYDAILAALDRLTAQRRETSRDPRMELLARLEPTRGNVGSRLTPYLSDYDPAVAARTAQLYRTWGRTDVVATPRPLSHVPVSLADAARLRNTRVRITMSPQSGGGSFEIRLFADEAPATVTRFVALARRGYYNGLTFHRMATNFVIQGGSPGANEYVGADRFMRDEVGLRSHERATLGISTRGRDTGDAQIFVNLIDNWRLDHDYTVFAEVVRGMDVVDAVLEGDTIARIEVLGR
jgi:cyclophilin family peptidyl-prolyl cis-trans isomerase/HEAT repeat protein